MEWRDAVDRLRREAHVLRLACQNPHTPWYAKWLAAGTLAYALSPIDLIPDFIPVLGLVDDALILPVAVWLIMRLVPSDVMADCRARAAEASNGRRLR